MKISVLDKGYVEFIEAWGKGKEPLESQEFEGGMDWERGIIEAARQSTQGSFRGWEGSSCTCSCNPENAPVFHEASCEYHKNPGDKRLLAYLYRQHHDTPFEFAGMVIEVQAPIMVFREWHRHRTQSYNEMSARYAPLPDLYYVPTEENLRQRITEANFTNNKQAQAMVPFSDETVAGWLTELEQLYKEAEVLYKSALDSGIPKELARLSMPVGHYSRMRASANLRNWLAFLTLRYDEAAQYEIREYAKAVYQIINEQFPYTCKLFVDRRSRST